MISPCNLFFGISWQRNMLKSWDFLSFNNITVISQVKICQNKRNNLHTQFRISHLEVLTIQKFINTGLVVLKISKVVKFINRVKEKKWLCLSSKFMRLTMPFLDFAGNLLHLFDNLLLYRSFLSWLFQKIFWCILNIEELPNQLMIILSSWIKETIEKQQHICKSLTHRYISNTPKQDNTFFLKFVWANFRG